MGPLGATGGPRGAGRGLRAPRLAAALRRGDWEAGSLAAAAALCAALPWLAGPRLGALLREEAAAAREAEELCLLVLAVDAAAAAHCLLVPARCCRAWALPLLAWASLLARVAWQGAAGLEAAPGMLVALGAQLALAACAARWRERAARELWLGRRRGAECGCCPEPHRYGLGDRAPPPAAAEHLGATLPRRLGAVAEPLCAAVVQLASDLTVAATCAAHESFFGRDVAGLRFADLLPAGDAARLAKALLRVAESQVPEVLSSALRLKGQVCQVWLLLADTGRAGAPYAVGIMLASSREDKPPRCGGFLDIRAADERCHWGVAAAELQLGEERGTSQSARERPSSSFRAPAGWNSEFSGGSQLTGGAERLAGRRRTKRGGTVRTPSGWRSEDSEWRKRAGSPEGAPRRSRTTLSLACSEFSERGVKIMPCCTPMCDDSPICTPSTAAPLGEVSPPEAAAPQAAADPATGARHAARRLMSRSGSTASRAWAALVPSLGRECSGVSAVSQAASGAGGGGRGAAAGAAGAAAGAELDGAWVVCDEDRERALRWLHGLQIRGLRARDGLGRPCRMAVLEGTTYLEGGRLALVEGALCRTARSGETVRLVRAPGSCDTVGS